jgi:hypothetical protein
LTPKNPTASNNANKSEAASHHSWTRGAKPVHRKVQNRHHDQPEQGDAQRAAAHLRSGAALRHCVCLSALLCFAPPVSILYGKREAAETFGGGINAFSRYENGTTRPPLVLAKLFKPLDRHPGLLREIRVV